MRYIEAPTEWEGQGQAVFLAGGISGCPDWQSIVVARLAATALVLVNPRRATFPPHGSAAATEQIVWEHRHLRRATAILFWFPCETLCPIALYELGAWSMSPHKPIFVGVHPDYARKHDIVIQIRLARPEVEVVHALDDLADQVRAWEEASRA